VIWDFGLARELGSATTIVPKHLSFAHYRNLFSALLAVSLFGTRFFYSVCVTTSTNFTTPASFFLFAPFSQPLQVSSYQYEPVRRLSGEFA